jgi:hypothetical protein
MFSFAISAASLINFEILILDSPIKNYVLLNFLLPTVKFRITNNIVTWPFSSIGSE